MKTKVTYGEREELIGKKEERDLVDRSALIQDGLDMVIDFGKEAKTAVNGDIRRLWEQRQMGVLMAIQVIEYRKKVEE